MPSYLCPRCDFTTSQRANFKRHLTRKNICLPVNTDTPIKSIAKSYGIVISTTEKVNENTNIYNGDTDTREHLKNTQGHKMYSCKYCKKTFNSSTSRCRHQRMYCKNKDSTSKEYEHMKKKIEIQWMQR